MDSYHNAEAAEAILNLARRCNKYIDETAPWTLAKDEAQRDRLEAVLYHLLECIRTLGILLTPFLPATAEAIFAQLQLDEALRAFDSLDTPAASYAVGEAAPLFVRIDAAKVLAEIETEQKAAAAQTAAAKPQPENTATLSEIAIDDFARVDLRVAEITACEPVKKSKKLLRLTLNDGSGQPRTVCSGIAPWYRPEELIGRSVIVVANLKPATLCGVESQGMILAADDGDGARVLFTDGLRPGSRIH